MFDTKRYKEGDEVLVKATVQESDSDGYLYLRFKKTEGDWAAWAYPSLIVGFANKEEAATDIKWVDVEKDGYPTYPTGYDSRFWVTFSDGTVDESHWIPTQFNHHGKVIAWAPFTTPEAYKPPFIRGRCKQCQHRSVCKFVHKGMLIEADKHCNGEHFKQQEG